MEATDVADLDLTSDLNALRYIASNPDLIQAFGANPQAARDHYNRFGRAEGRRSPSIRFSTPPRTSTSPALSG
jgi:hypothetical protein